MTADERARFTRRRLIATGGAATAAALVASPGALAGSAGAASKPSHLRRSSYTRLTGRRFRVLGAGAASGLTLKRVSDVAGTAAGSEHAFALAFSGPPAEGFTGGIQRLRHPDLGTFELFLAPVKGAGRGNVYEAVVNRSVDDRKHLPEAAGAPGRAPSAATPSDDELGLRARAHRSARGVTLAVTADAALTQISAWVVRGDRVLAAASKSPGSAGRHRLRLRTRRALRAGPHEVLLVAADAEGRTSSRRIRIAPR